MSQSLGPAWTQALAAALLALSLLAPGPSQAQPQPASSNKATDTSNKANKDGKTDKANSAAKDEPGKPAAPSNSGMDAPLFYQLLIGEMELRSGQPGVAFQVLLDAARRTNDEALFKRVIGIALQARAGDQALIAAKAWRDALPKSIEAHQTIIQLLAALNRPGEVAAPLNSLLALVPAPQRNGFLSSLPALFQKAAEPKRVYEALEPALKQAANQADSRMVAQLAQAQLALQAGLTETAESLVMAAAAQNPQAREPLGLALELMGKSTDAESLVTQALLAQPKDLELRNAYGRALARSQRPADAAAQFRTVTAQAPEQGHAWLALGTLELELRQLDAAKTALQAYLDLSDKAAPANSEPAPSGSLAEDVADRQRSLRAQAMLMLAQVAEQQGDFKAADRWLGQVQDSQRRLEVAYRRASLLARQGQWQQGRKLIQAVAVDDDGERRKRWVAESQLLRDAQQWKAAHDVLAEANAKLPDDADLIYEQAMMAERLGQMDSMETLLRKVMQLKPDHYHAYNALGYSLADRKVRLAEARELVQKALSLAPKEPFIIDSMGWVEYRQGRIKEAIVLLRQAFEARPDAEIAAHLGEVLWVSGEQAEARRIWAEGLKREATNEALRETMKRFKVQP